METKSNGLVWNESEWVNSTRVQSVCLSDLKTWQTLQSAKKKKLMWTADTTSLYTHEFGIHVSLEGIT